MGVLEIVGSVGVVVWTLLGLVLLGGLLYAFPTFRRANDLMKRAERLLDAAEGRMNPIFHHLRRSADNADYITTAVRADIEAIGETVDQAARSARRMLRMAEERAAEISGFLEVVQEEAESTFVSTATVLRAIRGAARRTRERRREGKRYA